MHMANKFDPTITSLSFLLSLSIILEFRLKEYQYLRQGIHFNVSKHKRLLLKDPLLLKGLYSYMPTSYHSLWFLLARIKGKKNGSRVKKT